MTAHDDPKLAAYRSGQGPLPATHWLWPLYGAGLENLGREGRPIEVPLPTCGPDQLLVRHDAVGLCFSDTKIISAGPNHPRITGRDMQSEPVVLGHEVALTVMQVGEHLDGRFRRGERYIVQADIYYKGVGLAYGYALQGGLSQYNVVGPEVLDGDEGCYLLPVRPETGYAQAALTEPWACVGASYDVVYRQGWKAGGTVLVAMGPAAAGEYALGAPHALGGAPKRVVALGVGGALAAELRRRAQEDGFSLLEAPDLDAARAAAPDGYDDIVLVGGDGPTYAALEPLAAQGGIINLVGGEGYAEPAPVDVGRLHYDHLYLTGTGGREVAGGYGPARTQLASGGRAAFLGAAGPMGQMHVQRALQVPDGPRLIVATDLVAERLATLYDKYGELIERRSGEVEVVLRTPNGASPAEFNDSLMALTGGAGYDDIVVLAPSAGVISGAVPMAAPGAVVNIFAGLARGTKAAIDLRAVAARGVRFTGTSGSAIRDLRKMLQEAEAGRLDPNLSVVAIAGLGAAREGIEGVIHQAFPGKVVIYPQVLDFPVTPLADLKEVLPSVYAKLGPRESWTVEAEAEFLKEMLP